MSAERNRARRYAARYGAPAVFLAAVTAAVLLVRAGLGNDEPASPAAKTVRLPGVLVSGAPARPATLGRRRFYVIRAGDTLEVVARRYGTSVAELLELNPGVEPTSLRIGQRIRTT